VAQVRRARAATRISDGQIHPLDISGVQSSREAQFLQGGLEICQSPQTHHRRDPNQLATLVACFHLAIDEICLSLPSVHGAPATSLFSPCPKMSRESREVQVQAITREKWQTVMGHALSERVDEPMRHVLRARTELKYRNDLAEGIDG
jgi:hypothetical protein